jgi:hypothetical protein
LICLKELYPSFYTFLSTWRWVGLNIEACTLYLAFV